MVFKAKVGRFDGELKEVAFNEGDTVQTLLGKVDLSLGSGEGINDEDGEEVTSGTTAEDGAEYYIVGNYKQG